LFLDILLLFAIVNFQANYDILIKNELTTSMDITDSTKALIQKAQALKANHADPASQAFIDFYCQ